MKASCALILAIAVGVVGCKSIAPHDIEGDWVIRDSSRGVLPTQLRDARAEIKLNPDGSFIATNLPDLLLDAETHPVRLDTGSGTWKLRSREGSQQVHLTFSSISNWKNPLPYGAQLWVRKGRLYYFLGDPDQGRIVSFERR